MVNGGKSMGRDLNVKALGNNAASVVRWKYMYRRRGSRNPMNTNRTKSRAVS